MYFHPIAMLHPVTNPTSDIFRCRIERQYLIQVAMIQLALHQFLDMGKISHHPVGIQLTGPATNGDNPIVAMQILTFARIREPKAMGS